MSFNGAWEWIIKTVGSLETAEPAGTGCFISVYVFVADLYPELIGQFFELIQYQFVIQRKTSPTRLIPPGFHSERR